MGIYRCHQTFDLSMSLFFVVYFSLFRESQVSFIAWQTWWNTVSQTGPERVTQTTVHTARWCGMKWPCCPCCQSWSSRGRTWRAGPAWSGSWAWRSFEGCCRCVHFDLEFGCGCYLGHLAARCWGWAGRGSITARALEI